MQIAILGPLEVRDDAGRQIAVAGTRLHTLLTRLAFDAGRPVGTAALVDAVWSDHPPAEETNALQTLVSRLRRLLDDPAAIVASVAGYRLAADPRDVDAHRFERGAAEGSAALARGDHGAAEGILRAALNLWRAPSLTEIVAAGGASLRAEAARLDDLHLAALIDHAEAALELGTPDLARLEALAAEHPLHERVAGLLMRALGATGRQADALHAYDRLRTQLADELGVDPSGELQEVHLAVLRGEIASAARPAPRRTNLKAQLTSFVGREDEVARIAKSLEQGRLVTLVGPGGAGKTRLASESAQKIVDTAPDGIWLAELAAVTSSADVPQAVLGSVGLREVHLMDRNTSMSARDALSRLRESLADRHAVLILDNCEHVIEASATLAEQLLGECPQLRVLATSREPLGILGEALLVVPPLGQPAPTALAAEALEYPAIQLFADRAAAVNPDFVIDDGTVGAVIEIVRRLDGLPLAIELAAARLRTMPIDDIAARLSDRFRLLTGGSRTALPRHRTLRAVVEWSWDLLSPDERRVAEQLAVFPSGVTVASATAVRPDGVADEDVPDLLASLVDKSLLQPVADGRRLRMLETIREYGAERLAERGALGDARERHAVHFAAVLDAASAHLTTAGQLPWLAQLGDERENILAALRFRCDIGAADEARRIAVQLAWYAMMLGDHGEVAGWLADAIAVEGGTDANLLLTARAAYLLNATGSGATATDVDTGLRDLRAIAHELVDIDLSVHPMMGLLRPAVAFFADDQQLVKQFAAEAMTAQDPWSRAAVRMLLANLAENDGDVETMRNETEIALAEFRVLGERWGTASTLRSLAQLRTLDGDVDGAIAAAEEALALMVEMGSNDDRVFLLGRLADLALRRDDPDGARSYLELARRSAELSGGGIESIFTTCLLSEIELRLGNAERAGALHEEAMRRLEEVPPEHPLQGHVRSMVLGIAARTRYENGCVDEALALAREAFLAAVGTKDLPVLAGAGVLLAEFAANRGQVVEAAELLGASARLRGADDWTALDIAPLTVTLRGALGDEFEAAYGRGRALAREAAIARLDPSGS